MIRQSLAAAAVAAVAVTAAPASATTELRTAFFITDATSLFHEGFAAFVERLNEVGEGELRIPAILGPDAVPEGQMGQALRNGIIDIAGAPPSYFNNFVPGAEVLSAAVVGPDGMRETGAFEIMNQAFQERANMYLLAVFGEGMNFHIYTNRAVETLADFEGMRLRTSPTYRAFFDTIGVQSVPTGRGEVYTAMERGVVDGFGNMNSEMLPWREVTRYRVDPGFMNAVVVVTVNLDTWNRLSDAQRDILREMAAFIEEEISPQMAERNIAIGEEMIAAGELELITLPEPDATAYYEAALRGTWDTAEGNAPELIGQLRPLIGID